MRITAYFGILTSLIMIDGAAIWQFYSQASDAVLLVLIVVLGFLGLGIIEGAILLRSQKDDEDQDDDNDDDIFESDLPPLLPDISEVPSCMRGYTPPAETKVLC